MVLYSLFSLFLPVNLVLPLDVMSAPWGKAAGSSLLMWGIIIWLFS